MERTDLDGAVEVSIGAGWMTVHAAAARAANIDRRRQPGTRPAGGSRPVRRVGVRDTIGRMTPSPADAARATAPVAYFWGDDDLATSRAVARMAAALGAQHGGIVERVEVRGDRNQAGVQIGQLQQLVTTQSMFGGGSLAVVTNAGALAVRNEDRAALLALLPLVAPGSGVVFVEASPSGAREPGPEAARRRRQGGRRRDPRVQGAEGRRARRLDRGRGARARDAPGPGRRAGARDTDRGFVTDNDADRRNQTMIADRELDKLSLYRPDGARRRRRRRGARR